MRHKAGRVSGRPLGGQSTAEHSRGEEGEERGGVRVASYVAQPSDCHLASQSDKIFTDKSLPLMLDMSRGKIKLDNF